MTSRRALGGGRDALWRAGAGAASLLFVTSAMADAEEAQAARERIVVTSERRPKVALDEPGSVGRLESAALARVNADHSQEALNRLPGVNLHRGSGQEHLTAIRSPVLTGGAGAGSFLFLEDGVPLRAAGFANVNGLFEANVELARALEVVRGPGSALYGSNAVHGLINVLTPEPGDGARADLTLGEFGRAKGELVLARGEAGGGALAAVSLLHEDGWRDAAGLDQSKLLLRWDGMAEGWRTAATLALIDLDQETAGFVQGEDAYKERGLARANANPEAFRDAKAVRVQARLDRALSEALSVSVIPFARWNEMAFLQHFLPGQPLEESGHQSLGALGSAYWRASERVDLVFGLDLEATRGALREFQEQPSFGAFPQGVHYDYVVNAAVAALYGQAQWELGEGWRLNAGLRVEATRFAYDNQATDGVDGRFLRPADRSDAYVLASPKLALVKRWGRQAGYLRYARGGRAPQTTDAYRLQNLQAPGEVEAETLDALEAGWRREAGAFRVEAAAYWMEKRNFFFRDADGFNVPDGKTRHRGLEFGLEAPLGPALTAELAASYAVHSYAFSRPVSRDVSESIAQGDDVDTAPRALVNARLLWRPRPDIEAELEWAFVDRYFMDAANSAVYPGHQLAQVRLAWRPSDRLAVSIAVRNLFDAAYAERADFAFGQERHFPGEPRAASLSVSTRF